MISSWVRITQRAARALSVPLLQEPLKDGTKESLIAPVLTPGSIVTTPRSATHMIVTEYGVANLKGKSTWERAELLINVAHPDFREDLIKAAEKNGIWKNTSKCTF